MYCDKKKEIMLKENFIQSTAEINFVDWTGQGTGLGDRFGGSLGDWAGVETRLEQKPNHEYMFIVQEETGH